MKGDVMPHETDQIDRVALSVDVVLLSVVDGRLHCLAARRAAAPHRGRWALPGVVLAPGETLQHAAARALETRAGLRGVFLEQLFTFDAPGRDPRGRTITVAYYGLVAADAILGELEAGDGASEVALAPVDVDWPGESGGPASLLDDSGAARTLAFDHADIIGLAVQRVRGKLDYSTIGFELLPAAFPLRDLQSIHEAILGRELNRDSFRRRMLASGLLVETGERERDTTYRPAMLYRFAAEVPQPPTPRTRKVRP